MPAIGEAGQSPMHPWKKRERNLLGNAFTIFWKRVDTEQVSGPTGLMLSPKAYGASKGD